MHTASESPPPTRNASKDERAGFGRMSESNSSTSGGIGICGILFVVFLVLKLAEVGVVAGWSWWWVTSPLWIPTCIVCGVIAVFLVIKFVVMVIIAPIADWSNRRSKLREFGD